MDFWDTLFDSIATESNNYGASSAAPSSYASGTSNNAEPSQFMRDLFNDVMDSNRPRGADQCRMIVENEEWYVPVGESNQLKLESVGSGVYSHALTPEGKHSKKKKHDGQGGRLLPIYTQEPKCPHVTLDGCALIRALPRDCDGLLIRIAEKAPREFGKEFFEQLRILADSCELEKILVSPGPNQVEALKQAKWLVEMSNGSTPETESSDRHGSLIVVSTHPERANYFTSNYKEMSGEKLFSLVRKDPEVTGILVNATSHVGVGEKTVRGLVLSATFAEGILNGVDIRPGARALPARNTDEINLWLDLNGFPIAERKLVTAEVDGQTFVRAVSTKEHTYRLHESTCTSSYRSTPACSPPFELLTDANSSEQNNTQNILCAGLLASNLNAAASSSKDPYKYWRVGRWLVFGRLLDEIDIKMSRNRLRLATELAKLLPPGADKLPKSAILTAEGAAVLLRSPHCATREWIEVTKQVAEQYTKRWVWGG